MAEAWEDDDDPVADVFLDSDGGDGAGSILVPTSMTASSGDMHVQDVLQQMVESVQLAHAQHAQAAARSRSRPQQPHNIVLSGGVAAEGGRTSAAATATTRASQTTPSSMTPLSNEGSAGWSDDALVLAQLHDAWPELAEFWVKATPTVARMEALQHEMEMLADLARGYEVVAGAFGAEIATWHDKLREQWTMNHRTLHSPAEVATFNLRTLLRNLATALHAKAIPTLRPWRAAVVAKLRAASAAAATTTAL